ncbi:MAG: hypothetical protein JWM99_240 [Verrucomicrobiales bacterium]|nr:hypothetical protein [Verrucomicrobiales bacterium]
MKKHIFLCSLAVPLAAGLSACRGPQALKTSFHQYSEAYATTVNEQMLLNLARKANGHPAYFLQMGLINATFSFSAAGGGNVSSSRYNNQIGPNILTQGLTGGGNLSLSGAETPTFTFTPLAGTTYADAIFAPINSKIFFNLLDQGCPVDQLMRTMVRAIEVTYGQPGKPNKTITIRNIIDVERQENYRNFLRIAGLYRELQKDELLSVGTDATGQGFAFQPTAALKIAELIKQPEYQLEPESEWAAAHPEGLPTNTIPVTTLKLRTFEGVLTALATEYQTYDRVAGNGRALLPLSERQPILRFDAKVRNDPATRLVDITYKGKKYEIADNSQTNTWNRDIFILLNHLFTQVAIDPNKLPVQQLIQVR